MKPNSLHKITVNWKCGIEIKPTVHKILNVNKCQEIPIFFPSQNRIRSLSLKFLKRGGAVM